MKTVFLFDADGVVITAKMRFSVRLAEEFGISLETTKKFFTTVFPDCIEGRADLKQVIEPYLREWKWEKSLDDFLHYWFTSEHAVDDRLLELIQQLRSQGIVCYVATNQEKYRTEYMKNEMLFSELFDGVISSAELGFKKPKQQFYQKIAQKLGVIDNSQVWFFDDTQENVDAAAEFGFNAYFYSGFSEFKEVLEAKRLL